MVTREQSLQRFLTKADEVIAGKYLFAIKKIEEMLLTIPSSKILFEVFEYCCKGEDAEKLADKYLPDVTGGGLAVLPDNIKQSIAVCFYILNEIVAGDMDFNSFLITRYPGGESFLGSYDLFIKNFIAPFRNNVKKVVEEIMRAKTIRDNRERYYEKPNIDTLYLRGVVEYLEEDRRAIVEMGVKDSVSADMLGILEEFIDYAKQGRTDKLKQCFVGYKYASMHLKKVRTHREDVEELLTDHGILN